MPNLVERRLIRFGQGGLVVCIPKPRAAYYGLKPGDRVEVISDEELTIRPINRPTVGEPQRGGRDG